jgi:hypothetical protein
MKCYVVTISHYYVIDLFSYFYGPSARYSLKYVLQFLVHIFYFIYNKKYVI